MDDELRSVSGFATLTVLSRSGVFRLTICDKDLGLVRDGAEFSIADNMRDYGSSAERLFWTFNSSPEARIIIRSDKGALVYQGNEVSFL